MHEERRSARRFAGEKAENITMQIKMVAMAAVAASALLVSSADAQNNAANPATQQAQSNSTAPATATPGDPPGGGSAGGGGGSHGGGGGFHGGAGGGPVSHVGPSVMGHSPPGGFGNPPHVGPALTGPMHVAPAQIGGRIGPRAPVSAFHFEHHDFGHFTPTERSAWTGGHWSHGWHHHHYGWWWFAGGGWFFYDAPIYPYPDVVSAEYVDESVDTGEGPYWYYCNDPQGYYPYVQYCNGPWQPVPSTPPDTTDDGQ
jgi:hypothetical protein